ALIPPTEPAGPERLRSRAGHLCCRGLSSSRVYCRKLICYKPIEIASLNLILSSRCPHHTVRSTELEEPSLMPHRLSTGIRKPIKRFLKRLGTGLITGAADDDPSGIATYSIAGASLGFTTLWTALVTLPLMSVVQFLCAKIGLVAGMGLAGVLRNYYSRWLLYPAILALVV